MNINIMCYYYYYKHWHDTGSWNPSCKTRTYLFYIDACTYHACYALALCVARASATMIFLYWTALIHCRTLRIKCKSISHSVVAKGNTVGCANFYVISLEGDIIYLFLLITPKWDRVAENILVWCHTKTRASKYYQSHIGGPNLRIRITMRRETQRSCCALYIWNRAMTS